MGKSEIDPDYYDYCDNFLFIFGFAQYFLYFLH